MMIRKLFQTPKNNVILTGLPRSGTTLACVLLNKTENCIALDEPMQVHKLFRQSSTSQLKLINSFFKENRKSLLKNGVAVSKHVGGVVSDNHFEAAKSGENQSKRANIEERGSVRFNKILDKDFRLVVKHPAAFTALLPTLKTEFACFAIIRNPLATLLSWNANNLPVSEGFSPAAEKLNLTLKANLASIENKHQRQIVLLNWYFEQFKKHIQPEHIIRYEDMVASRGRALSVINKSASLLQENLTNKNANDQGNDTRKLIALLEQDNGAMWHFYKKDLLLKI